MKTIVENEHREDDMHEEGIKITNTYMKKFFLQIQLAKKV